MSQHSARVLWSRGSNAFTYDTYSRDHAWTFEGGTTVQASAAPDYLGSPGRVDPEEAFVASVSSCHMLTFLALAARKRFVVERYEDRAVGTLEKNQDGKLAITRVELRPRIDFDAGHRPTPQELDRLHHLAHEHCFIANSVATEIVVAGAAES